MSRTLLTVHTRIEAAWERGARWAAFSVSRIRPRVSLASGSVLVLLTLFLPITVDSCGNAAGPGYNLALGRPNHYWPGFLRFSFESFGRGQYIISLILAGVSLLLVLGLFLWSDLARKRRLYAALFAVVGSLSLYTISDYFFLHLMVLDDWTAGPFGVIRLTVRIVTNLLAILAVLAPGLFWPKRAFAVWLITLPITLLVLWISEDAGQLIGWELKVSDSWFALPMGAYYLMPLFLWYWKGLSRRNGIRAQWPRIRLGLASLYAPLAAGNCLLLVHASQQRVWGLVPYVIGLHLISLGTMRLAEQGEPPPAEGAASP
jgi:hypothetical protein